MLSSTCAASTAMAELLDCACGTVRILAVVVTSLRALLSMYVLFPEQRSRVDGILCSYNDRL